MKSVGFLLVAVLTCLMPRAGFSQCSPTIPGGVTLISTHRQSSGSLSVWVCPGDTLDCLTGSGTFYLENNSVMLDCNCGSHTIYMKSGSRYVGAGGGSETIYYEAGASWALTGGANTTNSCGTLTYNYAGAPGTGCQPAANAGPDVTICYGNTVTLTGSGGSTYSWAPSANLNSNTNQIVIFTPPASGIYSFVLTVNGTATDTVNVSVVGAPIAVTASQNVCLGTPQVLSAANEQTYAWKPAVYLSATTGSVITASPTVVGAYTYSVTGTDANGCANTASTTLNVVSSITANAGLDITICSGTKPSLIASGGSAYTWAPGTGLTSYTLSATTFTITAAGNYTYSLTAYLGAGCVSSDTVMVTVNNLPVIAAVPDQTICAGNTSTLSTSGTDYYTWRPSIYLSSSTNNIITITPSISGISNYTVTGISLNGCSTKQTIKVTVGILPTISVGADRSICSGATTLISAKSNGSGYSWSPTTGITNITSDQNLFSITTPGIYSYTVTVNSALCNANASDDVTITVFALPSLSTSGNTTICNGGITKLSVEGGDTYSWSAGTVPNTGSIVTVTPGATGTYSVTGTNQNGCSNSATIAVGISPLTISSSSDVTINQGESVSISVTSNGTTFLWTPAASLSCNTCMSPMAKPESTTKYYVTITDNDCSITDSVVVTVKEKCGDPFVPDAFSPNGDNENDILFVRQENGCIQSMIFVIYDRWSNKVFQSVDPNIGWDGKYMGQDCTTAVFLYSLKATLADGTFVNKIGNISLIK